LGFHATRRDSRCIGTRPVGRGCNAERQAGPTFDTFPYRSAALSTDFQVIVGKDGKPAFVVVPYDEFRRVKRWPHARHRAERGGQSLLRADLGSLLARKAEGMVLLAPGGRVAGLLAATAPP